MALFGKPDPPKPDAKAPSGPGDSSSTPPASVGTQEGGGTPPPSTPAAKASKASAPAAKPIPALAIRSIPAAGFCRAGRRWLPEVQTVALSEFTKDQVKALREEVNLVVDDVEIQPEPEPED